MTNMDTNWISIVSLIVSIVAIPTLTGLVWKDIYNKRKENSEAKKAERKPKKDLTPEEKDTLLTKWKY